MTDVLFIDWKSVEGLRASRESPALLDLGRVTGMDL